MPGWLGAGVRGGVGAATRLIDGYLVIIFGVVTLATLLPARGVAVVPVAWVTNVGIGVLFFLYGARLSAGEAVDGLRHWRLHLLVLGFTFLVFPILGWGIHHVTPFYLPAAVASGLLFTTLLPSTVQTSVTFTSIAGGNVAAAVCAASFSNLVGVLATPALAVLLMDGAPVSVSGGSAGRLALQLVAPFVAGQLLQRWLGPWLRRHRRPLGLVDRVAVLLVVYSAFSAGMRADMWSRVSMQHVLTLLGTCAVLLSVVLAACWFTSARLGFAGADRIAIIFAGSKKSMASGLPMASVLFPPESVGLLVLPLMLFHQLQLVVCAQLARRWHQRPPADGRRTATPGPARPSPSTPESSP